ncbi:unnamed protein product [Heligmosomoides polygyrus]|uniref:BEN domain-containing protein n=1 Tax=Heligmosomoides polygyrus TaxID=6339 RepID=A0A183GUU8_HELPZ|nr:unnamed protein product [Heligmosomoides polygyrus]
MWLIVCTADRRYSVVNEKNVAKGNVSCGSRITVELGETKKDVTVIFMGKNRTQCDQYCQRLSKYCGVVDGKKPPVDPTLPNLPKRRKKSLEEPPSESSAVQTESLSEDPKKELVEPVDDGAKDNAAKSDDITIVSDTATHGEEIPSTSTEQAQEDNEDSVEVPQSFFSELLNTMRNLRNECCARFDRLDEHLEDLASRVAAVEEVVQRDGNTFSLKVDNATPSPSSVHQNSDSASNVVLGISNVLNARMEFPYPQLREADIIMIQKDSKTITSFARRVDRVLFANDPDKDKPIDAREDKAKVSAERLLNFLFDAFGDPSIVRTNVPLSSRRSLLGSTKLVILP